MFIALPPMWPMSRRWPSCSTAKKTRFMQTLDIPASRNCEEHENRDVIWQIAARRSTYFKLNKSIVLYKAKRKIEYCKAQTRAKVEHPFRVIKRQFGYVKVRFRGGH